MLDVVRDGSAAGRLDGSARLRSLVSSPFRRHVHALTHSGTPSPSSASAQPAWDLSDLQLLHSLPQLRRISGMHIERFSIRAELSTSDAPQQLSFPPLLESFEAQLSSDLGLLEEGDEDWSTESVQRLVLRALRPCRSLTELSITLRPRASLCLDGLLGLKTLQILTIDIEHADGETDDGNNSMFIEEQISVVKQLSNLRQLKLIEREDLDPDEDDPLDTRWLRWLCPLPHRLQRLTKLNLRQHRLHLDHVQLLQQLPALKSLTPDAMYESALPLLPAFANRLRRLKLRVEIFDEEIEIDPELFDFDAQLVRAPLFLPHLTPCARLVQLILCDCAFSEAQAETLCRVLPKLKVLGLQSVGWPSFESLRHLPRLEWFSLRRSRGQPLHVDVKHLESLQRLRNLTLIKVQLHPDDAVIDSLRPPSALLPGLVTFKYSP